MYCFYSFPSFPPGLSLYIICLSLNKPQGPYLLSPERHFKPNLSYSLFYRSGVSRGVPFSSQRCGFSHTLTCSHLSSSRAASHLHQTKQQHWVQPSQSLGSEALHLSSLISQVCDENDQGTCGAGLPCSQSVLWQIPVWSMTLGILLNLSSVSLFPNFKLELLPCLLDCMSKLINLSEKLRDYSDINRAGQETLLKPFNFIANQDKTIFQRLFGGLVIETNT